MSNLPRSAITILILVELGRELGLSTAECLRGTGLDAAALDDPRARVNRAQELTAIRNLVGARSHIQGLGLMAGSRFHLTALESLGYALLSCRTLRDALELSIRYIDLMLSFNRVSLERRGPERHVIFDDRELPEELRQFLVEADIAGAANLVRDVGVRGIRLERVELRVHASPSYAAMWQRLVGKRVEVRFGAERNVVVVDEARLDQPLPQRNERTKQLYEAQVRDELARLERHQTVAGRVRELLLATVDELPGLERVASALKTAPWTLRRKLAAERTSFRALVEECRKSLAEDLLAATGLAVEEVAARLGYSEPAAFTHAFTRWTGEPPKAFRARRRRSTEKR